ncbi:hypothetical protein J6S88_00845 [bacterium]|nr:hypothetical protein [bacterium]
MDNTGLSISFGIRSRNYSKSNAQKNVLARRIIKQVRKMYPETPECIIGETNIGGQKATVYINPEKQTLKIHPKEFTNEVLVRLSKYFHKKA